MEVKKIEKFEDCLESSLYNLPENGNLNLLMRTALEAAANSVVITDIEGNIKWVNRAFTEFTGYSKSEALNKNPRVLKSGFHDNTFYKNLWDTVLAGNIWSGDLINKRKDGSTYIEDMTITPVKNKAGEITNFIAIKQDISKQKIFSEIENLAVSSKSLDDYFQKIYESVKKIFYVTNFYICLFDKEEGVVSFPFFKDEKDDKPNPRPQKKGITEYILNTNKSLNLTVEIFNKLLEEGKIEKIGTLPVSWFGVPFNINKNFSGAIVLQSYDKALELSPRDIEWFESLGIQIATSIEKIIIKKNLTQNYQAIENASVGVLWINLDGTIKYGNVKISEMLGYSIRELKNLNVWDIYSTVASEDGWEKVLEELYSEDTILKEDEFIITKSSSVIPIRIISKLFNYEDEEFIVSYIADISLQKHNEKELIKSQYKFRMLQENSILGIIRIDEDGEIIMVNPAFVKMLGYSTPNDILFKNIKKLYYSLNNRAKFLQTLLKQEKISGFDETFIKYDGTLLEVRESAWSIRDENNKLIYYEVILEDITEQNQMFNKLHESEFKYRLLIDKLAEAVFLFIEDKLELANDKFFEILELDEEEIYKEEFVFMDYVTEESKILLEERDKKLKEGIEVPQNYEIIINTKNGNQKSVEVSTSFMNYNGKIATQSVMRDLTETKKQETQIRHLQKMEAIGTLASGIAHEINTPSQFVNDNLHFFQGVFKDLKPIFDNLKQVGSDDFDIKNLVNKIETIDLEFFKVEIPAAIEQSIEGISRIATIVGAMRDFAHSGPKEKSLADIHKLIESSITLSRNSWKYVATVDTDFDESIEPIVCQPNDLNQVIINTIVNASHAIDSKFKDCDTVEGKIKIKTVNQKQNITILIEDNGCGIPEKIMKRIFDPFFTTKEVGKGTGQGLAIAYDIIVNKHQGDIQVNSEEGTGTSFSITLPKNGYESE